MKRFRIRGYAAAVAAALIISSLIISCAAVEKDPAKKVLKDAVKVMGGESKLTGWTTMIERGTLTSFWPGWGTLNAECTHYTSKPDKLLLDQDYSANDHPFYFVYTLNGEDVWAEVNLGIRQNERYTDMMKKKMREIDGIAHFLAICDSFYIVSGIPDDSLFAGDELTRVACLGEADTVLFDFSNDTKLPVRKIETGQSGETHLLMDDYRTVSGRKVPFHLRLYQNGALTNEFKWEEISYDVNIDPGIFEKNRPQKQDDPAR
ncbi:MAG: hypothetical protein JW746_05070 [Candidatus Krumholzibacteriota bacterium]|nr:hypothetical protein [Candidatus Krumholzibacteriota bacterium]